MPPLTPRPPALRPRGRHTGAALLAVVASVCLVAADAPSPGGALGLGDRLYPQLGNPGYDVRAYDVSLTYHGSNTTPLTAVTSIEARATTPLERINLDFSHGRVRSVEVNGEPARFATAKEDLVVTPVTAVRRGGPLRITVRHTSDPVQWKGVEGGWVRTSDGLAMANQADAAHRVFPCNDHPSDKARFTLRITAPRALTVVAGGLPLSTTRHGATTTRVFRTAHPMATELAQVSIGRSTVLRRKGPHGLPVRDVLPARDRALLSPWLRKTPGQLAWLEGKVGRYPFETYGLLVADARTGFELETQTLSLFERRLFAGTGPAAYPVWYVESLMVHELAHQWFGDSVSPRTWSDLWLNEGHATWYEALYAQETARQSMADRMRTAYLQSDQWRAEGGPPAAPRPAEPGRKIGIFRPIVYDGSALVLYALRQHIGTAAFERLERAWVGVNRDGTATTGDFVRLASGIAGRDLNGFLRPWLYGSRTPAMPGHPQWRSAAPGKTGSSKGSSLKAAAARPGRGPAQQADGPAQRQRRGAGGEHG
ncbi:zinc metalloprotease [Streptomyces sulfonofaciens]|uniref:Aminopeptidase N n=1 Tax=Streptomyces sulfonofaciens TaxID=68272 RepID=A0A919GND7_9ACTN|nr:M1 family metallopeptidase [Streptomyces sulfonofaciens]GHH87797.1 zinc metalloprotease [Streptomyces sulfonofaciens]